MSRFPDGRQGDQGRRSGDQRARAPGTSVGRTLSGFLGRADAGDAVQGGADGRQGVQQPQAPPRAQLPPRLRPGRGRGGRERRARVQHHRGPGPDAAAPLGPRRQVRQRAAAAQAAGGASREDGRRRVGRQARQGRRVQAVRRRPVRLLRAPAPGHRVRARARRPVPREPVGQARRQAAQEVRRERRRRRLDADVRAGRHPERQGEADDGGQRQRPVGRLART